MAKTDPIPVRFTEEQAQALKRVAASCGVGEQDVARWAVEALANYYDHHGGRLMLPLRFQETFSVITLDPTKPMILHEPPHAESGLDRGAALNKRSTRRR